LRCAWAKRGQQQVVLISGRNGRRVLHGALNSQTGELVRVVRERSRTVRPEGSKLLIWDNAPPHHPKRVLEAAAAAKIEIIWLPFPSPELNPCEDLWRLLQAMIAANRAYASLEEEAERAEAWLDGLTNEGRLQCCGLKSSKCF
jgi:transposase